MEVRRAAGVSDFLEAAGPLLRQDEARHNLIFGICAALADDPAVYPEHHLCVVQEGEHVVAAALMTPPRNLVVARPSHDAALESLVERLADERLHLPGVTGAVPEAERFASAWQARTGCAVRMRMSQHIYRATAVVPVEGVGGQMRTATGQDRFLVLDWMRRFGEETGEGEEAVHERLVDHRLGAGGFVVWEDGEPVSVAGTRGQTPNGVAISHVYTPPGFRRRGYASALVAGLTARLLGQGCRFCFLYTDAANPTSNRIYQAVGYEKVCDSVDYAFDPPQAGAAPPDGYVRGQTARRERS